MLQDLPPGRGTLFADGAVIQFPQHGEQLVPLLDGQLGLHTAS
jgi:hypothetical protein